MIDIFGPPIAKSRQAADITSIEVGPITALRHIWRIKKAGLERPAGKGWAYEGVGQEWPILPLQRFSQPGVPDFVSDA